METGSSEETNNANALHRVTVEWDRDFDSQWRDLKTAKFGDSEYELGEKGQFRVKGRCKRCWGGLLGKSGVDHVPVAIRCRVCGILLEGDDAAEEYQRMSKEDALHMLNLAFGFPLTYRDDATFVQKVFPHIDRQSETEFRQRVASEIAKGSRPGWLTRSAFPAGSAGYLALQARALMSGVERLPRDVTVASFLDLDIQEDGSATVYLPTKELSQHPKACEDKLMQRLGSTMTRAMMSAFACELAMKAIRLTSTHDARRSHDLWRLYQDLPLGSRTRIEADFAEVQPVLKKARHTFGDWRYFDANVGGRGVQAMIDTGRTLALAKAARVLLDEVEMAGLGYSVKLKAAQRVTKLDRGRDVHVTHHLFTRATERPPR